jgi:hypothetical protein
MGRSWSVPVYILNGHFPDVFPADEDPVPLDGDPHPEHPPMVFGPNPQLVNWQNEQNGAAPNLGAFGGGLNQGHLIIHHVIAQPEQDNEDGEDNLNGMQIDADEPQPLHPQQQINALQDPPDVMDLDLSGSSMQFLRANGPDIVLDDVFQALSNDNSSSSSLSDATSMNENMLRFLVAQNRCAELTIFHRRGLPSSTLSTESPTIRNTISFRPILIDREVATAVGPEQFTPGLELVTWKPCFPTALLQLWPVITSILMRKRAAQSVVASERSMEESPLQAHPRSVCSSAQGALKSVERERQNQVLSRSQKRPQAQPWQYWMVASEGALA